jgi:hypothetical protein
LTGGSIPYSRAIFARRATSASTASSADVGICVKQTFMKSFEGERRKFRHKPPAGLEWNLKATAIAAEGAGSSGCGDRSRRRRLVIERRRDVADADDADQAVVFEHRQMADVVLVHQMTNMFERIGRDAGNQLLH